MKNFKLSFALIVAVVAVGATFASKASILGSRVITGCFTAVQLTDGSSVIDPLAYSIANNQSCAQMESIILAPSGFRFLTSANRFAVDPTCDLDLAKYCCITVQETTDTNAELIDLGEGDKRYEVLEVKCKPE